MIYEGTNHIQASTLLVAAANGHGRLFKKFGAKVTEHIQAHKDDADMAEFLSPEMLLRNSPASPWNFPPQL